MSYSAGTVKGKNDFPKTAFENHFETIQWWILCPWSVFLLSVHLDVLIFMCTWN